MSKSKKKKAEMPLSKGPNKLAQFQHGSMARARIFIKAIFILAGFLALCVLFSLANTDAQTGRFVAEGWGTSAAIIVRNKNCALTHAAFMTFCAAGFLWLFFFNKLKKNIWREAIKWALILLIAGDALWISRHYIKTVPKSFVEENEIVKILKKNMGHQRVALISQQGFYNAWLTYLFPYHNIKTVNITQMPRMPQDYRNFLQAVGKNPVRLWQLSAVGYVLAPAQIVQQIKNDPELKDAFDVIYSYDVFSDEHGGMLVMPGTPTQPGQHVVLRFRRESPRYALVAGWMTTSDKESLKNLGLDRFPLFRKLMIPPESADGLPKSTEEGIVGNVSVMEYCSSRVKLHVVTDQPVILRASEKYDTDWKATVDGKSTPLRRVDYIFQGVFIEPGEHDVVLSYTNSSWTLLLQGVGMLVCFGAMMCLIISNYSGRQARP